MYTSLARRAVRPLVRLGLVHCAAHTIAAATHVSSAQPQRPQVFLHLFICASFLQKLGSGAFISHHHEPKPGIVLSSHDGGGEGGFGHLYVDSHEFLHLFLSFLHLFLHFFLSAHPLLHTTWSDEHSSVHCCSFSHGDSGDGGGGGKYGTGGDGEGGRLGEGGGGANGNAGMVSVVLIGALTTGVASTITPSAVDSSSRVDVVILLAAALALPVASVTVDWTMTLPGDDTVDSISQSGAKQDRYKRNPVLYADESKEEGSPLAVMVTSKLCAGSECHMLT